MDWKLKLLLLGSGLYLTALSLKAEGSLQDYGLALTPAQTGWIFLQDTEDATMGYVFLAQPLQKSGSTASAQESLSLKADSSEVKSTKAYVSKWIKEFPKFGIEVSHAEESKLGELSGFKIELKTKGKKTYQFITKVKDKYLVFNCKGRWAPCQDILNTAKFLPK